MTCLAISLVERKSIQCRSTISSLQIGHTIRAVAELAAAFAADSPFSSETLEAMSCGSKDGGVEDWELSESELADGERCELGA